ncbi:unnamed protein product [Linum tenue]|uniref:Uncharacterized protein n=1 Tax=Linum tenue TaxID=586396 RepID=A0AAV0LY27_9ROSI|nr:unnamed protein product [Linum tenue]
MGRPALHAGSSGRGRVSEPLRVELGAGERVGWGADSGMAHDGRAAVQREADRGRARSRAANRGRWLQSC